MTSYVIIVVKTFKWIFVRLNDGIYITYLAKWKPLYLMTFMLSINNVKWNFFDGIWTHELYFLCSERIYFQINSIQWNILQIYDQSFLHKCKLFILWESREVKNGVPVEKPLAIMSKWTPITHYLSFAF